MSINPNATATLIFAGLALSHYNSLNDKWEIIFIRDDENLHNLRITFDYQTSQANEIAVGFGETITVEVTKPKSSSGKYQPKPFSRNPATDDPNDFRWILNFSGKELHDHAVMVTKGEKNNFFSTPNAVFYNYKMSDKHYELQKLFNGANVGNPVPLAAIGDYTGADIECEKGGEISITIEGKGKPQTYKVTPQSKVFFNNICEDVQKCASDFPHYYDIINDNGTTFDLIRQLQQVAPRSAESACETGTVGCVDPPPPPAEPGFPTEPGQKQDCL